MPTPYQEANRAFLPNQPRLQRPDFVNPPARFQNTMRTEGTPGLAEFYQQMVAQIPRWRSQMEQIADITNQRTAEWQWTGYQMKFITEMNLERQRQKAAVELEKIQQTGLMERTRIAETEAMARIQAGITAQAPGREAAKILSDARLKRLNQIIEQAEDKSTRNWQIAKNYMSLAGSAWQAGDDDKAKKYADKAEQFVSQIEFGATSPTQTAAEEPGAVTAFSRPIIDMATPAAQQLKESRRRQQLIEAPPGLEGFWETMTDDDKQKAKDFLDAGGDIEDILVRLE